MADAELQSIFSPNKPLEPDLASELQSIMRLHDLSAEDLFFKWESYCIKMDVDAQEISIQAVRNLKRTIQDALENSHRQAQIKTERKVVATPGGARARGGGGGGGGDVFGMLDGLVPSTPATGAKLGRTQGTGSASRRKIETPKGVVGSSPAGGMGEQLKAMNGLP